MNQKTTLLWAAAMGGITVLIGAFGAHALKGILSANGRLETFDLAVQYQFVHTLAIFLTGALMNQFPSKRLHYAALLFLLGILFFSGSLFVLSLTAINALGAVTPLGGLLFIAGWIMLFMGIKK
jgi:uncharacterized membrane protein YgdD (TMEM256/DUF423 family)